VPATQPFMAPEADSVSMLRAAGRTPSYRLDGLQFERGPIDQLVGESLEEWAHACGLSCELKFGVLTMGCSRNREAVGSDGMSPRRPLRPTSLEPQTR